MTQNFNFPINKLIIPIYLERNGTVMSAVDLMGIWLCDMWLG